jgi:hypothetical protein
MRGKRAVAVAVDDDLLDPEKRKMMMMTKMKNDLYHPNCSCCWTIEWMSAIC